MYPYLRGLQGYPYSSVFWQDILYNQPPVGLDVRLTIDLDLQKSADEWLGELSGAVIMLNANSGEIIVMASHPYFDASLIEEEWDNLVNNSEAPLINRVTQGVYPPGTTLLPFILASQIEMNDDLSDYESLLSDSRINSSCATPIEEDLSWASLISHGCLYAQEQLGQKIGYEPLNHTYQKVGFFSEPNLHLMVAEADPSSVEEDSEFIRGENPFNVSPLQMALAASAITNNGVLPGPRIINAYQDPNGDWVTLPKLSSNEQVFSAEITDQVINIIKIKDRPYWQATALVQTETESITWFVAGSTSEWPGQPMSLVVLLETDNPLLAAEIGQSLLEESLQNLSGANN
jgi:peptidoglycan glycosyltransferase